MAFALQFNDGAYVSGLFAAVGDNQGFCEVEVIFDSFSRQQILKASPTSSTRGWTEVLSATQIRHRWNNPSQSTITLPDPLVAGVPYKFRWEVVGTESILSINGTAINTVSETLSNFGPQRLGGIEGNTNSLLGKINYCEVQGLSDGLLTPVYRYENLTGTGDTWTEVNETRDPATLNNFPVDDSQWVSSAPVPSITLSAAPTYGATISGTYANFAGTPTGPLTASDGTREPTISVTVDAGASSFTGTFPALPAAGASLPAGSLPYPGNLSVTLPDPGA